MIGDQRRFLFLKMEKGGNVTFGNDVSSKMIGKQTINLGNEKSKEEIVLLIEYVKHNLLNVSQVCD